MTLFLSSIIMFGGGCSGLFPTWPSPTSIIGIVSCFNGAVPPCQADAGPNQWGVEDSNIDLDGNGCIGPGLLSYS